jgi:hypothetical protein
MITPYLDYGKACAVKELGLPQPAEFEDGQIWYTPNGTPILIYEKDGEGSGLGAQSLTTGRLYPNLPRRVICAVYCPTKEQYFHWVKNFKG